MAPGGQTLYQACGATFRIRNTTIAGATLAHTKRTKKKVRDELFADIDSFEEHAGLISKKKAMKMAFAKQEEEKKAEDALKKKIEEGEDDLDAEEGEVPETGTQHTRYVSLPLPQCQVYDFGAASVYPLSVKAFNTGIRERVHRTIHGPAHKTYISAECGGEGTFSIQDTCLMRPSMTPIIPRGVVCAVPPLGRTVSQKGWVDRGGHEGEKLHSKVHMNKSQRLRQRLNYRHNAQDEMIKAFDEQYSWETQRGNTWKITPQRYHKYLDNVVDNPPPDPWWEKAQEDFTDDEKMAYAVLSMLEEKIHASNVRAKDIFYAFDTDNSGEIDPVEFQAGLKAKLRVPNKTIEGLKVENPLAGKPLELSMDDTLRVMKLADYEFDGVLSLKEMDRTILAIGHYKIKTGERARYTFDYNWQSKIAGNVLKTMELEGQMKLEADEALGGLRGKDENPFMVDEDGDGIADQLLSDSKHGSRPGSKQQ